MSFEHFFDFFDCLADGLPLDTTEDWEEVITMRKLLTALLFLIGSLGVVDIASAETPEPSPVQSFKGRKLLWLLGYRANVTLNFYQN